VAIGAQSSETQAKTTVDVQSGKEMKVTGCVTSDSAGGYMLTEVAAGNGHELHRYTLVSDTDDFSKVVGHRVQIEGKVADRGDGKVEIKTETKVEGPAKDTHSKTEGPGAYIGVKHMKMIAGSCS
jgi:hypothetical protein